MPAGPWTAAPSSALEPTVLQALQTDQDLLRLRADEITEFHLPDGTDRQALALLLVCDGDTEPADVDWPFDVSDWEDEDEDIPAQLVNGTIRWAHIDDDRVSFLTVTNADRQEPVPILTTADGIVGTQIAHWSWDSEAGMTSGAGSTALYAVGESHAVSVPSGDDFEFGIVAYDLPRDPSRRAEAIVKWLTDVESGRLGPFEAAALSLEPLDPAGTLDQTARDEWLTAIRNQEFTLSFALEEPTTASLRHLLSATDARYATIKTALLDPTSDTGQQVLQILREGEIRTDL